MLQIIKGLAPGDGQRLISTVEHLSHAVRSMATMPRRFPVIGWTGGTGIRKRLSRPYVILFDVQEREIVILRIVHERSDWMSLV